MKRKQFPWEYLASAAMIVCLAANVAGQTPVAWWSFDEEIGRTAQDRISGKQDAVSGKLVYVPGVKGTALQFDGFTTLVTREAKHAPQLSGDLTVEAWVALATYPWNWCPIVSQSQENQRGYFFGIDARGHVGLHLAVDGQWVVCASEFQTPLKTWIHVAGSYDSSTGEFTVYIDGQEAGKAQARGRRFFAHNADLLIGMNPEKTAPFFGRTKGNRPSWFSMDGKIDEIKVYDTCVSAEKIAAIYQHDAPPPPADFPERIMPSGLSGPGRFGAYYTQLKYYKEWDDLWSVDSHSDIIVQFDDSPIRVVFWRGTRYSPVWVTENNIWMADQSFETGTDEEGCIEHMQDTECRYSQVRIIENTRARVVIHWRYAPVGSRDFLWIINDKTGRALWVDEYYTFYPDGTGVRKMIWPKFKEGDNEPPWIQIQETIVLCHPGQAPEDVIHDDFITFANFDGDSQTYIWNEELRSRRGVLLPWANIQVVNLKSTTKPFIIFEERSTKGYIGGNPGLFSKFSTCNHWPVAQISSDGRDTQSPDRASHFLGTTTRPVLHESPEGRIWGAWLYGMTEKPAAELASLGKSWALAPDLQMKKASGFEYQGYDIAQRAYRIKRHGKSDGLEFTIAAGSQSPLENACLVIENWGSKDAVLTINGKPLENGVDFRLGHIPSLDGDTLVVWINRSFQSPAGLSLQPAKDIP